MQSETSSASTKESRAAQARALNEARSELLEDLRTGFANLSKEAVASVNKDKKDRGGDCQMAEELSKLFEDKLAVMRDAKASEEHE